MLILNYDLDLVVCTLILAILFFITLIVRLNNFIMSMVIIFLTFLFITILLYYFGFSFVGSLFLIIYGGGVLVLYFVVIQFNNVSYYSNLFNNKIKLSINPMFTISFILTSIIQFITLVYFKFITVESNNYFDYKIKILNNNYCINNVPYNLKWSNNDLITLVHLITTTHSFILLWVALTLLTTLYLSITLLKTPYSLK